MANNYTQMSMELKGLTDAQELWLRQIVEILQSAGVEEEWRSTYDVPDEPIAPGVMHSVRRVMRGGDAEMCYGIDFEEGLIIYMEGSGDLEGLVSALCEFSRNFKLDYAFGFEWANTCSRMRPGEFGGGAVVIKPEGRAKWNSTGTWLAKELYIK